MSLHQGLVSFKVYLDLPDGILYTNIDNPYIYISGMAIQRCRKILRDLGIFQAAAIFSVLHMRRPFAPRPQPPGSGKYEVQNGVSTSYTMTWIPDRCAHDLHSLSTFVSPES